MKQQTIVILALSALILFAASMFFIQMAPFANGVKGDAKRKKDFGEIKINDNTRLLFINNDLKSLILKSCPEKKACIVDVKRLTKFGWTKMFFFRHYATIDDIHEALGMDYPYYKEFADQIVFLNGAHIVYHESHDVNIERIGKGILMFTFDDSLKFMSYTPDAAKFVLKTVEGENGEYYEMIRY